MAKKKAADTAEEIDPNMVTLDNIGPIKHFEMKGEPGTITVLRGRNGRGKSTVLEAVGALTRGESGLTSLDGTVGGVACGFGVTIKVGRNGANRRMGDLEVTAVEDRLSIADFVDPGIKDPVASDARRLKALASLAGMEADPSIFWDLCGGKEAFETLIRPDTLKETDPVALADRIKRDLEAHARQWNTTAERIYEQIKAKQQTIGEIDLTKEHDGDRLQFQLESAIKALANLEAHDKAAAEAKKRQQEAAESLKAANANYSGLNVLEATSKQINAAKDVEDKSAKVEAAKVVLREAQLALDVARNTEIAATRELDQANQHAVYVAEWQKTINALVPEAPPAAVVAAAITARDSAKIALERGVLIRQALDRKKEVDKLEVDRKTAVERSESYREMSKSVLEEVAKKLVDLLPEVTIDHDFRIVVPHEKRGECYYQDLSDGEKWKLALDIAVEAFRRRGERGVLAISQSAWEALDGINRKTIASHVSKTDLIVYTAEATRSLEDEELVAEVLQPN